MIPILEGTIHPDAALRGVTRLLEAGGPKRLLKDLAGALEIPPPDRIRVIRQRMGQRMVLRVDATDSRRADAYFVKLTRSSASASDQRLAWQREAAKVAARFGVIIPAPVATLPRFRAVVYPAISASPFLPCIGGEEPSRAGGRVPAPALPPLLGASLASLHAQLPHPDRVEAIGEERGRIERALAALAAKGIEAPAGLINRLEETARRVPPESAPGQRAVIHGDLHPLQILAPDPARDAAIVILDWDVAAMGDAERDLGNLVAHFTLESEMGHIAEATARRWTSDLLEGYAAIRRVDPARFEYYRRTTLLRIAALHADPSFGHAPPNSPDLAGRLLARI